MKHKVRFRCAQSGASFAPAPGAPARQTGMAMGLNFLFFVALSVALAAGPAAATPISLTGDLVTSTVPTQFAGQNWDGGNTAVVGPGVEFSRSFVILGSVEVVLELDVTDDGFIFRFTNNFGGSVSNPSGAFNLGLTGLTLSDLDPVGGTTISGLVLNSSNWPAGVFDAVTLGPDNLSFNFVGKNTIIPGQGTVWTADFTFEGADTAVPEPSSLLLLASGLIGAAIRRRRSHRPPAPPS